MLDTSLRALAGADDYLQTGQAGGDMKVIVMTVSDRLFFPGTLATVNSVYRFHGDDYEVVVVDNGLSEPQRKILLDGGVRLLPAADAAGGLYPGPWELKAHGACLLAGECDVLVGIDSDCVLTAPIDDLVAAAAATGRWLGGRDGDGQQYGDDYRVYGIDPPAFNARYMSTSLYGCACTAGNRELLRRWSSCCDRAQFNGRGPHPGHGDQGVLNALLYAAGRGANVELLPNELWSQHWVYWTSTIVPAAGGSLVNVTHDRRPQRALHVGGTEKFWTVGHSRALDEHPNQVTNYAWFLSLLWFGRCADWPLDPHQYLPPESHHLVDDLVRYHHPIAAVWPAARERWHPSDPMLERMVDGVRRAMSLGTSLSEYLRLARLVPVGGRIVEIGSYEGGSVVPVAIAVLHREVAVYSVESFTGDLDGSVEGHPLPRRSAYLDNVHTRYPDLRLVSTPCRSCDVSRMFPDAFFDLIFIDAAHDAKSVEADVRHWLPKLRPGGTIAGDDWEWESVREGVLRVFPAEDVRAAHSVWSVKPPHPQNGSPLPALTPDAHRALRRD